MAEKRSPVEALRLALSREEQSIELYKKLGMDNPLARDVFDFLLSEEHKHKNLVEKKIFELTRY